MTFNIEKNEEKPNLKLFCEVTKNSYGCFDLDNTFDVFRTVNDLLMLVYSTKSKSIICYDLVNFCILTEIKRSHNTFITNIRHFINKNNKMDIIISISDRDNNLKVWDINNCECILNIFHANNSGFLCSACLINEDNNIYILSSNCNTFGENEKIKIYDLKGKIINQINDSNEKTCLWDKDYAFVACKLKIIKLVNLTKGIIEKNLEGHYSGIFTIKKINHPKYGECLLSQGYENDQIKLWINQGK